MIYFRLTKEKQKIDPNAPIKPKSAFYAWLKENRAKVREENPGLSISESRKKMCEIWDMLIDKSVSNFYKVKYYQLK